ncbi:MAG: hypothetical protein RLZZ584_2571 [Pseudomonadota bacterium]
MSILNTLRAAVVGGAAIAALLAVAGTALAHGEGEHRRGSAALVPPPVYVQECGACHVAYPAGLLPLASWESITARLDRHYGVDASLDAAAARQIKAWLQAQGGTSRRARELPPEGRITRAAWFVRKHDEVPASTWKLAAVKSPSNCNACHARAEQGDFDEHDVRIPR